MALDLEIIRRRKRRARIVLLVLVAVGVGAGFAFDRLREARDGYLAAKIDAGRAALARRAGLTFSYGAITTDMTTNVRLTDLRLSPSGGGPEILRAANAQLTFELAPSLAVPVKLTGVSLEDTDIRLAIDSGGKPNIPLELLSESGNVRVNKSPETPAGDSVADRILGSLMGVELAIKRGRVEFVDERFARTPPGRVTMNNVDAGVFVDLVGRRVTGRAVGGVGPDGGSFEIVMSASGDAQRVELSGRGLSLAFLAPYLPEGVRVGDDSRLDGDVTVTRRNGDAVLPVRFDGELRNLTVEDPRLAPRPITGVRLKATGDLRVDHATRRVEIPGARVYLGPAFMDLAGSASLPQGEKPVVDITARADALPVQALLDALPRDFAPKIVGARADGAIDASLALFLDFANPRTARITPAVEVRNFRVTTPPGEANVFKLKGPFTHTAFKKGQAVKTFVVGPENPDFVPYESIGRTVVGAVLTCEDGRFFRHHGFVLKHVQDSIVTNLKKERFARGASTVSMQTTKNLFLSQEKTASRKFQEMLLTWWMEEEIPKERILEIYLNIIEWGPGIYGIGPAARHYFGKHPSDLSALQAAFLGSIISNPVYFHRFYDRGYVGGHSTLLAFILGKMAERGTITADIAAWCEPYQPVFSKDGKPAPGGCVKPEDWEERQAAILAEQEALEKTVAGADGAPKDQPVVLSPGESAPPAAPRDPVKLIPPP
ncbi:transglycosylase domain-containing protein, partial [bacterium]|nr:transglycosylase domain-containing protein [bacterium]